MLWVSRDMSRRRTPRSTAAGIHRITSSSTTPRSRTTSRQPSHSSWRPRTASVPLPICWSSDAARRCHHLFPFADRVDDIHVADYLPSNLDAVQRCVRRQPGAHDWSAFARYALRCELGRSPTRGEGDSREDLTRQRITGFVQADARNSTPIVDERARHRYGAVLCCFCPDSITADRDEWRRCMLNIASLVAPRGWFVLAALRATAACRVGDVRFPSAGVTEHDVAAVLAEAGYPAATTTVTVAQAPDDRGFGFRAVTLAMGRRSWN